ncbi:unnamed protein product [Enterobius vermicularis]|uniref:Transmembrane protein n=1 Tax=Enterobius vermicularis TaxID=51028 RepID=A0A0N4VKX3_ENTVE|nr:unnamed protein product [Enterobius vermicularis]
MGVKRTRTSGIVLIAGVSSYLAYRIFTRIRGNRLFWTIVDFARIDFLNQADLRFLCQDSSPIRCCRWVVAQSPCNDGYSPFSGESSSPCSVFRSSRIVEEDKTGPGQVLCFGNSSLRRVSEGSASFSEQSSSIRLQWDDPSWEAHSDSLTQGFGRRRQSLSPSNVSDFSEFRSAKKVFDDLTTLSFEDHGGIDEGYMDATPTAEESSGSISETHEFIERNCMTDSKHLYRIVSGCSPGSDTFSVRSSLTSRSFQSLRHCAASTSFSNGLLDLTTSPSSCVSGVDALSNSMTDSAISRGSASTGDERWSSAFLNEPNAAL